MKGVLDKFGMDIVVKRAKKRTFSHKGAGVYLSYIL